MANTKPIPLYGYPVSNYFNAVRGLFLEKGLGGDFISTSAKSDADITKKNPLGKIPFIKTPEGFLSETIPIFEYIETTHPTPSLAPHTPYERALVRQLLNICQVYLEDSLRRLYPGVFMGEQNSSSVILSSKVTVDRAIGALEKMVQFSPYLLGSEITHADIFAFYIFDLGERVFRHTYDKSLLKTLDGAADWHRTMKSRDSTKIVLADFETAFSAYLSSKKAAWVEPKTNGWMYA